MNCPAGLRTHWLCRALVATSLGLSLIASTANATLAIFGEQKTLIQSSSVQRPMLEFFVDLTDEMDGGSFLAADAQIIVRLTGPAAGSEVKITSIDETIVHPQVAPLTSRAVLGPTQASAATATPLGGGGPITVDDLDGLAKLTLEVAPGALGVYNLEILAGTDRTFFTAPDATTVIHPDAFVNGKLTIAAVPEPSAALLGALALMLGGGWTLARRWFGTRRT